MPTLPSIEVTEEQYDVIMDAFDGDTQEDKDTAYRDWHTGQMVHYVQRVAYLRAEAEAAAQAGSQVEVLLP